MACDRRQCNPPPSRGVSIGYRPQTPKPACVFPAAHQGYQIGRSDVPYAAASPWARSNSSDSSNHWVSAASMSLATAPMSIWILATFSFGPS